MAICVYRRFAFKFNHLVFIFHALMSSGENFINILILDLLSDSVFKIYLIKIHFLKKKLNTCKIFMSKFDGIWFCLVFGWCCLLFCTENKVWKKCRNFENMLFYWFQTLVSQIFLHKYVHLLSFF